MAAKWARRPQLPTREGGASASRDPKRAAGKGSTPEDFPPSCRRRWPLITAASAMRVDCTPPFARGKSTLGAGGEVRVHTSGSETTSMSSSEGARKWVTRWKYEMTANALRPGIWGLKEGGYFLRTR